MKTINLAITAILMLFFSGVLLAQNSNLIVLFNSDIGYHNVAIREAPDGNYFVAGSTKGFNESPNDLILSKVDPSGHLLWRHEYNLEGYNYIWRNNGLTVMPDGGVVMVAESDGPSGGGRDMLVIRTKEGGGVVWRKYIGGGEQERAYGVTTTETGGVVVVGFTRSFGPGAKPFAVKLDGNGNIEIENATLPTWVLEDVVATSDGGFLFTSSSGAVLKTNSNFGVEWSSTNSYIGLSAIETPQGDFLVAGNNAAGTEARLTKFSSTGNVIFDRFFPGTGVNQARTVRITPDGNYLVFVNDGGSTGSRFIKTDQNGTLLTTENYSAGHPGGIVTTDGSYVITGWGNRNLVRLKSIPTVGFVTGSAYADRNNNCTFDAGDDVLANRTFMATPGPYFFTTDNAGNYNLAAEAGNYTVSHVPLTDDPFKLASCQPASFNVEVVEGITTTGDNFALQPAAAATGIDVTINSVPFLAGPCTFPRNLLGPCPGFNHRYLVTFTNNGTTTLPGPSTLVKLDITLDPGMTFVGIVSPSSHFTGTFPNFTSLVPIPPGAVCTLEFEVAVTGGSVPPWNTVAEGEYDPPGPGAAITAIDNALDTDGCPCDPNDKAVTPAGCGPYGYIENEELMYKIRFENVGGTPAIDVVIADILDSDLDPSTIQLVGSSHSVTQFQVFPNDSLSIRFDEIKLPGIFDAPKNNGYVIFRISPDANLPEGTEIENTSSIFFDYNAPVITNTVLNTVSEQPIPVAEFEATHSCTSTGLEFDFTFTGGTADNVTFNWDFSPNATPQTSTDENPTGILFSGEGDQTVTLSIDRFGCSSSVTHTVEVADIACGNNKVSICHNGNTLCINQNALAAHLAHGDCLGSCESVVKSAVTSNKKDKLNNVAIFPNPSTGTFAITFDEEEQANVTITDVTGRIVFTQANATTGLTIDLQQQSKGLYFVTVQIGDQLNVQKVKVQ
jgi:hypothetical protein